MDEPLVPLADMHPEIESELRRRGARQLNLYRALSSSPDLARAWLAFIWTLRDDCRTPRPLRELMILRTAVRHASCYEWAHHAAMARAEGVPESRIDAVKRWPSSADEFAAEERTVLELADAICDGTVPDALAAASLESFGPQGHVELVVTAAAYVMVPRVLDGLRVPLEEGVVRAHEGP
jgi:4-carboxymuconolactone decarboxylase